MRFDLSQVFKKVAILIGSIVAVFLMTGLIIAIPYANSEKHNDLNNDDVIEGQILTETREDLEAKNSLMNSPQTDYKDPEKESNLKIEDYVLKNNETIGEVAKKFGVSIGSICGSSGLRSYDMVPAGTKLRVPNKEGIVYKVKKGEKLIDISNRYKISLSKILEQNRNVNPDFLAVGNEVFIPDAKPLDMMPGFLWPVAMRAVTSKYGMRFHPISGEYMMHSGVDIRAKYNWVRATRYGRVTYTGWLGGYGYAVIIAHPGGFKSLYGHLSKIIVRDGQYVRQGQTIARSGNTGYSTGPHLHFEIQKNGINVNPRKFIK